MMEKEKVTYVSLEGNEDVHRRYEQALTEVANDLGKSHPMYIGGREVRTAEQFEVRSPVDRDILIGMFQKGGEREAREGIAAGKSAALRWEETGWKKRVGAIRDAADILERELYRMAAVMTVEVGKDRTESVAEMGEGIDMLRYYCDVYEHAEGFEVRMKPGVPGERCTSVLRPHGLWVVIAPFNFPFALAAGMTSAALLAGNTVVFKPTSEAPLTGIGLYRAYERAGIPAGAINCVTGPGGLFGKAVISNPDVDGISFTGSRAVGMQLFRDFAENQRYP
ncbi:MAG: aldehyde dehydrogenase family protein, partial [Methanoregulaceae archaeon]|nr:aldehyde dehydrogenase family protein [Methanoregulaceae archaeon]